MVWFPLLSGLTFSVMLGVFYGTILAGPFPRRCPDSLFGPETTTPRLILNNSLAFREKNRTIMSCRVKSED